MFWKFLMLFLFLPCDYNIAEDPFPAAVWGQEITIAVEEFRSVSPLFLKDLRNFRAV